MRRLCTLSISTSSSSSPYRGPPCRRMGVLGVLVIFWTMSMTRWLRPLLPFVKEVSLAVASVHTGSRAPGGGGIASRHRRSPVRGPLPVSPLLCIANIAKNLHD